MMGKNAPPDALGGAAGEAAAGSSSSGYIVVETNYRLYAYTGELCLYMYSYPPLVSFAVLTLLFPHSGESPAHSDSHSDSHVVSLIRCVCVCVCADSAVQTALVAIFSRPIYHFPGLLVANITRDSVAGALANGITSQQVTFGFTFIWTLHILIL